MQYIIFANHDVYAFTLLCCGVVFSQCALLLPHNCEYRRIGPRTPKILANNRAVEFADPLPHASANGRQITIITLRYDIVFASCIGMTTLFSAQFTVMHFFTTITVNHIICVINQYGLLVHTTITNELQN